MRTLLTNCQSPDGIKNIIIRDGIIDYIGSDLPEFDEKLDCANLIVLPGMIDPHVHVRDLEMTYKESWETASNAAIAGGITTIMDMPNTKPATTNFFGLNAKRKAAEKSKVNYYIHLGATTNNLNELRSILEGNPEDIIGIKLFLAGSSSNEVVEDPKKLEKIFLLAKEFDKVVLVHSEMQSILNKWQKLALVQSIEFHNSIRHREAAINGTRLMLDIAQKTGAKLYICHVSTREEIDLIRTAKRISTNIFSEVTPHHLILNETILKQAGNFGKVNPPLRTEADNEALLEAIKDRTIDCLGTDHAPHAVEEKRQEYSKAPSGFPGLETAIPQTYFLVKDEYISLRRYSELISCNAAYVFGLNNVGELKAGFKADLIILDPGFEEKVIPELFKTKAKYSPFEGVIGHTKVKYTFVNGEKMLPFRRGDVRY
ncbi:MAG: hypothetical protein DRH79_00225 [Candidatus Cloacimonadota bacterium]|nr:MAG: hypothetical protein DRH79_00225 [Candidatus Cloacimonadota bacterium]